MNRGSHRFLIRKDMPMIEVKPFRGVRPISEKVKEVVSPPYDVLDSDEARERVRDNPLSFLRVIKPEIELDPSTDPYDPQVYKRGAENLNRLISQGVLIQDERSCLYIYKLRMGEHEQVGLVAIVGVEDYVQGRIKKHEHTRPEKEMDRASHIDELNAQTGPVFVTYRSSSGIDDLIEKGMARNPVYDFIGDHDVRHTFYVIDDEQSIQRIQSAFARIEALYVADGHHRSAAALRVRDTRKKKNPKHTGKEAYNFFLTVIFPHDQLRILDYNRVIRDLDGISLENFLERIKADGKFRVEPYVPGRSHDERAYRPPTEHSFGMYLKGQWYCLTAQPEAFDRSDPIDRLDVSILQKNLLTPVLGIEDPRIDKRIRFVGGIRGLGELERLVDGGDYAVAFSLYPTGIEHLMDVADAGKVMPPKSTWFEPKLGSGIIVHKLD